MVCQTLPCYTNLLKCTHTGGFIPNRLSIIFTTIVQNPISLWFLLEKYQSMHFYMCTSLKGQHRALCIPKKGHLNCTFQQRVFFVISLIYNQHENNNCKYLFFPLYKDFLRNIPGSTFSSDLYDHWVCVMDQGNDEEKIHAVQR